MRADNRYDKVKKHVVKSNILVDGQFDLTATEMKILLIMIAKISIHDTDFKTYRLYMKDFIGLSNNKVSKRIYEDIRKIMDRFQSKVIHIPTDTGTLSFNFVAHIETYEKLRKGYVDYSISPLLKPYLLRLKERFTYFQLEKIIQAKSLYTIRIYEILKSFEGLGERTLTLDKLKFMLNIKKGNYERYAHFKQRILETARKELKLISSDIFFEYKPIKEGRKVHAIKFEIKKQKEPNLKIKSISKEIVEIEKANILEDQKTIELEQAEKDRHNQIKKKLESLSLEEIVGLENEFVTENENNLIFIKRYKKDGLNNYIIKSMWYSFLNKKFNHLPAS